jgi:hypothetical protein
MLSKLFGSKSRVKILKLFVLHPGERFYISKLSRKLGLQINPIKRELDNLEQFGLIKTDIAGEIEKGNEEPNAIQDEKALKSGKKRKIARDDFNGKSEKMNYEVNTDFVLYNEIKELIIKAQILNERDFVETIKKTGKIKLFILTGLFVNQLESMVDMLIVGQINKPKFLDIIKELEQELGREVNFTLMNTAEYKYRKDMTDVFLYRILEGKNIVIIDELNH